ncbi:MAG: hypothetical protein LAT56_02100 [Wenzhouxiangella sp.]|nr:hypothetical protein [Wenzhouxiangella sp.]
MTARLRCSEGEEVSAATASAWVRSFADGRRLRREPGAPGREAGVPSRAWMDVLAAWQRGHQPQAWAALDPQCWPYVQALERARVERLAAIGWPGMATNLADGGAVAPHDPVLQPLYLCARLLAAGDGVAAENLIDEWAQAAASSSLASRLARVLLGRTGKCGLDARQVTALLARLRELMMLDCWREDVLKDAPRFAAALMPLVRRCAESLPVAPEEQVVAGVPQPLLPQAQSDETAGDDPTPASVDEGLAEAEAAVVRAYPGYSVFSQAADEIGPARRWYRDADRALLDQLNRIDRRRARQLAHRLQRRLEAARRRQWMFDQEDGLIDSRRLARLVVAGGDRRVFRQESPALVPAVGVSLLVDMSGSMCGQRRLSAAVAIDLAVHVLEISGVHCEVLGYTTVHGDDNPIERAWRAAGARRQPGRLNAIRHVVFKGARQPWRRCRPCLGLLLRQDFGHENIDGEALHWAAQRLFAIDVPRRILVVLSDGAPFDKATAGANGRDYLCAHLREVIARLDSLPLHLLAMGAGTDVSRFYRKAVTLEHPDAVAETLFHHLGDILTMPFDQRDTR